ncbi:MAG: heme NO-binding domain-containing protein [Rhodospirillum sp.]|nr:heme NO-binding domain-containing protein [Rhodospirillum sp.]MCF8489506.1 heme NO-binding domain-containing protein [Rhodospirillum sp.]
MLGVMFTEFMDMVEATFSMDMVDDIIDDTSPASGGAYTAVGAYDSAEMMALVAALSTRAGIPTNNLTRAFGKHLFARLAEGYPDIPTNIPCALDPLAGIESRIHGEVRKLYPDADLPHFETERPAPDRLEVVDHSTRPLLDLAMGLIEGCAAHFGETLEITMDDLSHGAGTAARFTVLRVGDAA